MKYYLTTAAAALFLLAAPAAVFAQDTIPGSGDNDNASQNQGGSAAGNNDGGNDGQGSSNCPAMAPGQGIDSISAKCRAEIDTWASGQAGTSIVYEGEVAVGTVLPENVEIVEVPAYRDYGYVMLNDRRVLVDRGTRTIVHVY